MPSRSPTSSFEQPAAINSMTSTCRSVKLGIDARKASYMAPEASTGTPPPPLTERCISLGYAEQNPRIAGLRSLSLALLLARALLGPLLLERLLRLLLLQLLRLRSTFHDQLLVVAWFGKSLPGREVGTKLASRR
jgi:hypothetical protein